MNEQIYRLVFYYIYSLFQIHNDLIKEESIPSGFGSILKLTSKVQDWYNLKGTYGDISLTFRRPIIPHADYEKVFTNYEEIKKWFGQKVRLCQRCIGMKVL